MYALVPAAVAPAVIAVAMHCMHMRRVYASRRNVSAVAEPAGMAHAEDPFEDFERRARERRAQRAPPGRGASSWMVSTPAGRMLLGSVLALALFTLVGLVALWPHHHKTQDSGAFGGPSLPAEVVREAVRPCGGPSPQRCRRIEVELRGGPDKGGTYPITLGPLNTSPHLSAGTNIRVARAPEVARPSAATAERYSFVDVDRHVTLIVLALVFAALAVLLARWRGLLAVVGVAVSLLLVTKFIVPAILEGSSPALVSLVGALAVMFLTLLLTNGVGAQSLAAALGIGASLLLVTLLGEAVVHLAHLNGYSSDLAIVLNQSGINLSLQGIVLAGMVIGALGVLTDMAVSQASAVMALRRANPNQSTRQLYWGAFTVGRDHLSATIHTLVLAYTGAALPLLLVLQNSGVGFSDAVNTQDVAEPLVAMLVGAIGLIAAVPLTTGLAATLVTRVPVAAIPDHAHQH